MKALSALTNGLIGQYGGRKKPGRLSIFVDTMTGDVYPVPINVEHVDVARRIWGEDRERLQYVVPVHIDMQNDSFGQPWIVELITGESGMEALLHVEHSEEILRKAEACARNVLDRGDIHYAGHFSSRVVRR